MIVQEALENILAVPCSLPHLRLFVNHEIHRIVQKLHVELQSAISFIFQREANPFFLHSQGELFKNISSRKMLPLREKLRESSFSIHTNGPVIALSLAETSITEFEITSTEESLTKEMVILLSTYGHFVVKRLIDEIPSTIEFYFFREKIPCLLRKVFSSLLDEDLENILYEEPHVSAQRARLITLVTELDRVERKLYLAASMQGVKMEKKKDMNPKRKRDEIEKKFDSFGKVKGRKESERKESRMLPEDSTDEASMVMEEEDSIGSDGRSKEGDSLLLSPQKLSSQAEVSSVSSTE